MGISLTALIILVAYGTAGYTIVEHYSVLDAVFVTVSTITTIGFTVKPLDGPGEVLTMTVIVLGVIAFLYTFGVLVESISSGSYREYRRVRRMTATVNNLRDHVIVCGYGRTGKQVVAELQSLNHAYIVVEMNESSLIDVIANGEPHVVGDATADNVLRLAGVDHARALVSAVNTDERAVYIVLSARSLRPDLYIVARSSYPEADAKLRRAGADRVVSPYRLSGERLAALALQPAVVDTLDMVRSGENAAMRIEELVVRTGSSPVDAAALRHSGATVLAFGHDDGSLIVGPEDSDKVVENDIVVAMGTREQLNTLATMLTAAASRH